MNIKYVAKFAGSAFAAVSAVRSLSKARRENDRLRMIDAVLSVVSAGVAVAIVVREIREDKDTSARVVELEDHA